MTDGKFSSQSAASARRRALTLGARFGAGVAAGGLSVANAWANERLNFMQIEGTGHPVRIGAAQHEDWDVVVIGSGAAGLAAALEARRAGARVVILEKMGSIGGNSVISEGLVGVPGTPMQAALGIHDSPALFAEDLLAAGYVNHPGKVRVLAEKALETFEWTRDELGVRWWEDRLEYEIGQSVRRTAVIREAKGGGLVYPLYERARALGVVMRLRTKALHFLEIETDAISCLPKMHRAGNESFFMLRAASCLRPAGSRATLSSGKCRIGACRRAWARLRSPDQQARCCAKPLE